MLMDNFDSEAQNHTKDRINGEHVLNSIKSIIVHSSISNHINITFPVAKPITSNAIWGQQLLSKCVTRNDRSKNRISFVSWTSANRTKGINTGNLLPVETGFL